LRTGPTMVATSCGTRVCPFAELEPWEVAVGDSFDWEGAEEFPDAFQVR